MFSIQKIDDFTKRYARVAQIFVLISVLAVLIISNSNGRLELYLFEQDFRKFGLLNSSAISIFRVILSCSIAFVLAISCGLFLRVWARRALNIVQPIALFFAITPPAIWLSVSLLALGISELAIYLCLFASLFFFILGITALQINNMDEHPWFLAKVYKMSNIDRVLYVLWPYLNDSIFVTLRIAMLVGWISITYAESSGVGSGLGAMLIFGRQLFDWHIILVAWLLIVSSAIITDFLALFLMKNIRRRRFKWK